MRAGDIVRIDFGIPAGSEAGFIRPAVVVTADAVLAHQPRTIHVVPLTTNRTRSMPTEVNIDDGPDRLSVAQCHLCTVISTTRIVDASHVEAGVNVGAAALAQLRSVLGDLLDIN